MLSVPRGIRRAHDNAVDAPGTHDGRDVLHNANNIRRALAGSRCSADLRGIAVDETYQFLDEFAQPLEQRARQAHGCNAGAGDEQPISRLSAQRQRLKKNAPSGDKPDNEQRQSEDAAAESQRRNPIVQNHENHRRGAK